MMIELDDETVARLVVVAEESHTSMEVIAASILHDVLLDDEQAHCDEPAEGAPKVPDYLH